MKVSARTRVEASPADVYAALTDPPRLAQILPGVEHVDLDEAGRYRARALPATHLGVTLVELSWELPEARPHEWLRIAAHGVGGDYAVTLDVELALAGDGAATDVRWSARAQFHGVVSSLGQRVLPTLVGAEVERLLGSVPAARPAGGEEASMTVKSRS